MIFIFIGGILLFAGGLVERSRRQKLQKILNIKYYPTSSVASVIKNYEYVKNQLGKGVYNEVVELKGKAKGKIIESPVSKQHVVYCRLSVLRRYERKVKKTDAKGKSYWSTQIGMESIHQGEYREKLILEDESGSILIDPQGADMYPLKSVDRIEKRLPKELLFIPHSTKVGRDRTLGYHITEYIIPVNNHLYVLGEANDRIGELCISKPQDPKESFIISAKTEEELIRKNQQEAHINLFGTILLGVIGIVCIVYGIMIVLGYVKV